MIRRFGFKIPKTLVTNDPAAVASFFAECHGKLIFKSISGVRSKVRLMTNGDFGRLELLENCPALFQDYLTGDNIRVRVIGERLFAVRIQCEVNTSPAFLFYESPARPVVADALAEFLAQR